MPIRFTPREITTENFLQRDPFYTWWIDPDIGEVPPSLEEHLNDIKEIQLADPVPIEVRDLFAFARGAYAYSFLCRPLMTMASHYAFLAVEAALYLKYRELGGPKHNPKMGEAITFLYDRGPLCDQRGEHILPPDFELHYFVGTNPLDAVQLVRKLRNSYAHPKEAKFELGYSREFLFLSAKLITSLYQAKSDEGCSSAADARSFQY